MCPRRPASLLAALLLAAAAAPARADDAPVPWFDATDLRAESGPIDPARVAPIESDPDAVPYSSVGYPPSAWVGPACSYTNSSRGWGDISFVVIHTCEGSYSGCWSWLVGCHDVSAHYVVSETGAIANVVADADIAWHVGCLNGSSIGIEHEGSSYHPEDFTDAMYCASAQLTRWLCDTYGIPRNRSHIIGHGEANDLYCGGDHWDPGSGWNWGKYMDYVNCGCGGCCTGAPETCNGVDDDCDGAVDEGLSRSCGSDVGACESGTQACSAGAWGTCAGAVWPAAEACNGVDDDCDGVTDEALSRPCGTDVGECVAGLETCAGAAWGPCEGAVWPVDETCNRLDDDCDGAGDEEQVCEIEEVSHLAGLLDPAASTDVDGDGLADACARTARGVECRLASGHGFEAVTLGPALGADGDGGLALASVVRLGDLDGDRRADVCARDGGGVDCWLSTGDGLSRRVRGPALSAGAGWDQVARGATLSMADVDGDGAADLCVRDADGLRCHRLGPGGETLTPVAALPAVSDAAGWGAIERWGTLRLGDLDGDGRADVCGRAPDGVVCWRSGGRGFDRRLAGPAWTDAAGWGELACWSTIRLADVDGDGRADLCGRCTDGFRCHLSDGEGFGGPAVGPPMAAADGWGERAAFSTLRLADVDGDRAADLCALDGGTVTCWPWTGNGFGRRIIGPTIGGAAADPVFRTLRIADVTGDERADACIRDAERLRCWRSNGDAFVEMLLGPAWSDADGWSDDGRFASLRLASPARVTRALAVDGGCGCRTGGDAPPGGWLALLALAIVFRKRRMS